MSALSTLEHVDIYLIDQLLRGAIGVNDTILDAGCGSGRNLRFFVEHGYNITAFDPKKEHIAALKEKYPDYAHQLYTSTIENFEPHSRYDYIICSAVLHFVTDHAHFETMFSRLVDMMATGATLFVRMTTTMGLEQQLPASKDGIYDLPDGTHRYLVTRSQLDELCAKHHISMVGPPKTVLVDQLRSMGIFVFKKN